MNDATDVLAQARRIDLTREADFEIGGVLVRPTACEVVVGGRTVRLQPRVMQVMVALARARGRPVSREALVEICWGRVRVGDDALNRCIQRLRRLAETETDGALLIETIPKLGYRLAVAGGAVGEAPETGRGTPPGATPIHRRWWLWTVGPVLVLAVAGVWFAAGRLGWPASPGGVAVATFDAPPGDGAARSLADGLGEGIAGALAKTGVRVMPPDADRRVTSAERDAKAVLQGAAFVVGGRVQRNGPVLDVAVRIDDPRRYEVLWSANFSGVEAAEALQGQLAYRIDNVLRCAREADDDEARRVDRESLRAYLRVCGQIWSSDPDDMKADEARTLLRRIVKRNPTFAHGWAELARASEIGAHDLPRDQAAAARQEARAAAERALRLDPRIAVAYVALADMIPAAHHLGEREDLVEKGLSLAPDHASLNHRQAWLLAQAGRLRESLAYTQRCEALDPLRPDFMRELALLLAGKGRLAEGRQMIDRAAQTWPDDDEVRAARIEFEARYGAPDRALALLDDPRSRPASVDNPLIDDWRRFIIVRRSQDRAQVTAYARDVLVRLAAGRIDLSDAVLRLNSLGATDWAFAAIARAPPTDSLDTEVLFAAAPGVPGMWRDPRFMPLAARLGLVDFWRRSGKWPDFCDAPDRPYDCRAAAGRSS